MISSSRLPYPGLRAFTREESDLFFGRDGCVDAMVDRLAATRFLAVLGSSGSGKSSLVRTGLLDALDLGLHPWAGTRWKIADLHPGGQPIRNLAAALLVAKDGATHDAAAVDLLAAFLRRGPRSVAEWAAGGNLEPGCNLLLLVDQFEELFRYGNYARKEEAEAFVALLLETTAVQGLNVHVVLTMRSEFIGASALMPGLAEKINAGLYLTPRMTREECREAIEGPAGVMGFSVEPALVNRLLNDLGSFAPWEAEDSVDQAERLARRADQLPLMQHVLNRLWARAANEADGSRLVLRLAEYDGLGGLSGAIDAHGREILAGLGEARAGRVEAVFRSLVSGAGVATAVRRPCRMQELVEAAGDHGDVVAIVEAFSAPDCNFLRTSEQSLSDAVIVDISHESLIRQWTPLRLWLENEARAGAAWRRLVAAEERYSGGEGGLLTGLDLQNLAAWWESSSPTPTWAARHGGGFDAATAFLEASRRAETERVETERKRSLRERNRLRFYVAGLAVGLLVSTYLGYRSHQEANLARTESEEAMKAEAKARSAEGAAIASAAESKANAQNSAKFLNDLSDVLYSDEISDIVGTRGLRSRLMGKLLPYQTDLSQQNADAFKPEARVRNNYREALSFQSIGDAQEAMAHYQNAYEGGLKTIQALPECTSAANEALTISFLQDAYYYAWYLMDIGERQKSGVVLETTKDILGRCHFADQSSDALLAEGRFENLESRYAFDTHQTKLSQLHLRNAVALARRAIASPNASLGAESFAVSALESSINSSDETAAGKLVDEICKVAGRMNKESPMSTRSVRAQAACLTDQSDDATRRKDPAEAMQKLQGASGEIKGALGLDPDDPSLLIMAAGIENSLGDLYYRDRQEDMAYQHRMAAKDYLVKALSGRTPLQVGATQLRTIFENCARTTFPNTDAELKFYQEVFNAMATTLNAFPKSPTFAYIAGEASVHIGEILGDKGRSNEAEKYLSKSVAWFDSSGVIHDLSVYSGDFDAYCWANLQRSLLHAKMERWNDVVSDTRKLRSACAPVLKKYPWAYYVRTRIILADGYEGEALLKLQRYKEAVPLLRNASYWGDTDGTTNLAALYRKGQGVAQDEKKADQLEELAKSQKFVTFLIPMDFGYGDIPSNFHVWEWPAEYTQQFPGIDDQVRVYKEEDGATIDAKRTEAIRKIQEIATRTSFSFPLLCWPGAYSDTIQERYQELVKDHKQEEADRFEQEMTDAAENLVKALQSDPARRAAWGAYLNQGEHLETTRAPAARRAFEASARHAELLPKDSAEDQYRLMLSYQELGDIDFKGGKIEDAQGSYLKAADVARKSFDLAKKNFDSGATADRLNDLRFTSDALIKSLAKLKRDEDEEKVRQILAAAVTTLLDHTHTDEALLESSQALYYLGNSAPDAENQSTAQTYLAQARDYAKKVTEDTPDSAYGRYLEFNRLGAAFLKIDRRAEAHESYVEASASLERYIGFRLKSPPEVAKADSSELYELYGNLSWASIEAGEFDKGIAAAEEGLKRAKEAGLKDNRGVEWIEANLAHGLLLTGKRDKAIEHYMNARNANLGDQSLVDTTKEDFDHLQKLGLSDPEMTAEMASILTQMQQK